MTRDMLQVMTKKITSAMKVRSNGGLVHVKFLRLLSAFLHLLERYTSCFKPLRLEIHVSSNVSKQRNLGVHNQFLFDRIFIISS